MDRRSVDATRAHLELTPGAFALWVVLHSADLGLSDAALSAACGLTKSSGARHLDELHLKGYLSRRTDGRPRVLLIVLDVRGRNLYRKI